MKKSLYIIAMYCCTTQAKDYYFESVSTNNFEPGFTRYPLDYRDVVVNKAKSTPVVSFTNKTFNIGTMCANKVDKLLREPGNRKKSDKDSVSNIIKFFGSRYEKTDHNKVQLWARTANQELSNQNRCDAPYDIFFQIGSELIFDDDGWQIIYTANKSNAATVEKTYKIGSIICSHGKKEEYSSIDNCSFNGPLDAAYQEFYKAVHNNIGSGWGTLIPTFKKMQSRIKETNNQMIEITASDNNHNTGGEVSIIYNMPSSKVLYLTSNMPGGETDAKFKEEKNGKTIIELTYSAD